MPPHGQGPIPAWVYLVLGAVAAAAIVSLVAALMVRLPPAMKRAELPVATTPTQSILPLDLPYLPQFTSPTEVPPSSEPTATVVVPLPPSPPQQVKVPPAAAFYPSGAGRMALVIDDMGMEPTLSARAMEILPAATTLAFMAEAPATVSLATRAKAAGHSILVHLPMEPQPHAGGTPPLGPLGVTVAMDSATLVQQTRANLAPLAGIAEGVNNHMGSRFTQNAAALREVLQVLAAQNLYFLDSRTAAPTATRTAAAGLGLGLAARDVFLDHTATEAAIRAELLRAVKLAQKRGISGAPVVVIGHPLPATLQVLAADLALVQAAGITLVPLRDAVK